ncbi:prepilin peptidase [Collinsella tanakaei]|uniref:prepilin peptidase n=1 Tax=Collinsella tanakaei TaxID=626935 RepID=UPI0025A39934|nr:prepilin peptidase [Collinsella tanakaei]MDM8300568.1 prepilin peptidase [Collinsella tanakaei]
MGLSSECIVSAWCAAYIAVLSIAAVVDARTRTFPNRLAGLLLLVSAAYSLCGRSLATTVRDVAIAFAVCSVLVVIEVAWRRAVGRAGLGMGDIKFLFASAWCGFSVAVLSFAAGLIALGACALVFRRASWPLLPFVVPFQVLFTLAV